MHNTMMHTMMQRIRQGRSKPAARGQNLVELVLVFPLVLLFIYTTIEVARVWQAYEGAKMAALDGAYTASMYTNLDTASRKNLAETVIKSRLQAANLCGSNDCQVSVIPSNQTCSATPGLSTSSQGAGYRSCVTVQFHPIFGGGFAIPSLAGPIQIIPSSFPISYTNVSAYSVY